MSSLRYFSSGDTLWKKTSKPRRWGRRCLPRMAERIPREFCITKRATLALRRLENSLPGNTIRGPAVASDTYPSLGGLMMDFATGLPIFWIRRAPDLQLLPIPTLRWKDLSMDFVTGLPISTAWKGTSYSSILVIVDQLTRWKDLSMDFVTGLPIATDWKGTSHDSILVIVDRLTKMVHYEPVQITISTPHRE